MTKDKTLFEKIADREIPATIIYEDEMNIAFLNIFPFDRGHLLVIPKKAYKTIWDMPDKEYISLQQVVRKISAFIYQKTGKDIAIIVRNGEDAGQEIPHVHYHIVPRYISEKEKPIFNDGGQSEITKEEELYFKKLFQM